MSTFTPSQKLSIGFKGETAPKNGVFPQNLSLCENLLFGFVFLWYCLLNEARSCTKGFKQGIKPETGQGWEYQTERRDVRSESGGSPILLPAGSSPCKPSAQRGHHSSASRNEGPVQTQQRGYVTSSPPGTPCIPPHLSTAPHTRRTHPQGGISGQK